VRAFATLVGGKAPRPAGNSDGRRPQVSTHGQRQATVPNPRIPVSPHQSLPRQPSQRPAMAMFMLAGLPAADAGVVINDKNSKNFSQSFIDAMGQHRFWSREADV